MNRPLFVLADASDPLGLGLPQAARKHSATLRIEQAKINQPLLRALPDLGYDAVLCWAERPEELEIVVRVRKATSETPIVLVSDRQDPEFRALAFAKGATSVLAATRDPSTLMGLLEQALAIRRAARETRQQANQTWKLARELRELVGQADRLVEESRRRLQRAPSASPIPLLVSDDADEAFRMIRAFEKADLFAPLPVLRSTQAAVDYLSGQPPYQDRARYPLPTLLLIDLHAPPSAGIELLAWVRQEPSLKQLPVMVLGPSADPEDIQQAYGVRANSYVVKPAGFAELVALMKSLKTFWSTLHFSGDE
jgi:CheY-like chemotaxis protein